MGPMVRHALPRLLLVALVGGAFLPIALARGEDGINLPSDPPAKEPREEVEMAEDPATAPEPEEGVHPASDEDQPVSDEGRTASRGDGETTAHLISVKARTAECVDSSGSESRLGMMRNSAVYSHCP